MLWGLCVGVLGRFFVVYSLVCGSGLVGILFPHVNDNARSKSHRICSFIIYTACQILGVSKNSGKMGEECGMHGSEGNLE